jgi:DNA-binding CsgD family transcriptional regulator
LFLEGDHEASAAAARESLRLKSEVGDITGIAYCLEMLAFLAAVQDRCKRTAWLLGAADTLWGRTGKRLGGTAEMEGLHQQAASIARDRLGSSQYAKLFGDGAARELSVTIDLAGSDTDRLPVSRGSLTRREQEIAALVFEGLTNAQIARRLVVSSRTVDAHVASIYAKLGVSSRAQLAAHLGQRSGSADRTFS